MKTSIDGMIDRLTERQRHEFALACARRVQHLMTDPRSVAAPDTRERWLRGEATDEEMVAAAEEAWSSASSAAESAARVAARVAARTAAESVAWTASDAAGAASWAAVWSAADAAWDAERAWQREELERMLQGGAA